MKQCIWVVLWSCRFGFCQSDALKHNVQLVNTSAEFTIFYNKFFNSIKFLACKHHLRPFSISIKRFSSFFFLFLPFIVSSPFKRNKPEI